MNWSRFTTERDDTSWLDRRAERAEAREGRGHMEEIENDIPKDDYDPRTPISH